MAIKASDNFKVYRNENGPSIGTVTRNVIEKDGFYFKDIDGTGEVTKVNDWRLPAKERAAAYAETLTEKKKSDSYLFQIGVWENMFQSFSQPQTEEFLNRNWMNPEP